MPEPTKIRKLADQNNLPVAFYYFSVKNITLSGGNFLWSWRQRRKCISSPVVSIKKDTPPIAAINTSANEECPYVYGDYLFFISNRADGFGGTDIYYSKKDDKGNFGTPINLGENVNTEYNEYRVSCYFFDKEINPQTPWQSDGFPDFVIFSSDRPGGLGGYDLYLSILKEIEVVSK